MLIILFVYPVIGATIRLGILARERRLQINPIAATVPIEHAEHGRWATGGLLVAVLLAFTHALASGQASLALWGTAAVAASVAVGSFVVLLRSRRLVPRLIGSWGCWLMLLLIVLQPLPGVGKAYGEALIWQSHTWGGLLLLALLLLTMAVQREIATDSRAGQSVRGPALGHPGHQRHPRPSVALGPSFNQHGCLIR